MSLRATPISLTFAVLIAWIGGCASPELDETYQEPDAPTCQEARHISFGQRSSFYATGAFLYYEAERPMIDGTVDFLRLVVSHPKLDTPMTFTGDFECNTCLFMEFDCTEQYWCPNEYQAVDGQVTLEQVDQQTDDPIIIGRVKNAVLIDQGEPLCLSSYEFSVDSIE